MFEVVAAKPKAVEKDPPVQASMRASSGDKIRRNPSTDQRKVRRQMQKKSSDKNALVEEVLQFTHNLTRSLPANEALDFYQSLALQIRTTIGGLEVDVRRMGSVQHVAALPTATAGEGAYVTNSHMSSIRRDVAPGTKARAVQGYVTWIGTKTYDWAVDGLDGDSWSLGGEWFADKTASARTASSVWRFTSDTLTPDELAVLMRDGRNDLRRGTGEHDGIPYSWVDYEYDDETAMEWYRNQPGIGAMKMSSKTAGSYDRDDWSPQDGPPKYPDRFREEFGFDYEDGPDPDDPEQFKLFGRRQNFAPADVQDTRPLHTRVAAAFLKKG